MIRHQGHFSGPIVVKMRKSNFVLSPNGMPDNYLINVIKFVPVLVKISQVSVKRLEFRTTWNSYVQGLSCEERFEVKQVIVIFVNDF